MLWVLIGTVHLTVWYYHVTYAFQSESIPHWWIYTLPLLDVRHCYKLSLYVMSRKKQDPKSRKWWKTLFWAWFSTVGPEFGSPKLFFSKILASSVTKYHSQLSCAMPGKTNDPILRTFSDGWTDSYFLKDVFLKPFWTLSPLILTDLLHSVAALLNWDNKDWKHFEAARCTVTKHSESYNAFTVHKMVKQTLKILQLLMLQDKISHYRGNQ